MTFFLRKAFSFGPVRFNLSKSGVGVSGGVTGARIGVGPRGAYVAGGRHGLYYRESISSLSKKPGRKGSSRHSNEVNYFVDTGLTYHKGIKLPERTISEPSAPRASIPALSMGLFGLLLLLIGFGLFSFLLFVAGMIIYALTYFNARTAKKAFTTIEKGVLNEENPAALMLLLSQTRCFPGARRWLDFHVFKLFHARFYENPDYISPDDLKQLESMLTIQPASIRQIKTATFSIFLDEILEDHMISEEEEGRLNELQQSLGIEDEMIRTEKQMIKVLSDLRDALIHPLEPIETDVRLHEGEVCYLETEGRLLKEKIINRYQRNLVQYKETGYDVDMEGKVYLTDKRILIVGSGSRSYPLSRVMDVTLSLEDYTVILTLDNRKNPLIFSMPDIAAFAGKVEKLVE